MKLPVQQTVFRATIPPIMPCGHRAGHTAGRFPMPGMTYDWFSGPCGAFPAGFRAWKRLLARREAASIGRSTNNTPCPEGARQRLGASHYPWPEGPCRRLSTRQTLGNLETRNVDPVVFFFWRASFYPYARSRLTGGKAATSIPTSNSVSRNPAGSDNPIPRHPALCSIRSISDPFPHRIFIDQFAVPRLQDRRIL